MPDSARIWIYQADRKLSEADTEHLQNKGKAFCEQWAAHGAPLKSSFRLFHQQFLVFAVDESYNMASGCSIDASSGFVKQLEQELNLNFFDRSKVAFIHNDDIVLEPLTSLKSKVADGAIAENTITFNNLISVKGDLESSWMVPAGSTWLSRYFN